jgi:uncharacterized membrane protein YhaH (DUF805 family)
MTFGESISTCLSKFADGKGRATRSEFWYFYLFYVAVWVTIGALQSKMSDLLDRYGIFALVLVIALPMVQIAVIIPTIAASVRRMHDIDKSGWFVLIPIYNLVLLATPGTVGPNRFGADPADPGNWAPPTIANAGQGFPNFPNPESDLTHTYAYAPTQKTRYPGWLGWALLAASPIFAFSPFIIAAIGAQLTCDGGLATANEANCGWAALPWAMIMTIPGGILLAVVGLVMGIVSAFRNG